MTDSCRSRRSRSRGGPCTRHELSTSRKMALLTGACNDLRGIEHFSATLGAPSYCRTAASRRQRLYRTVSLASLMASKASTDEARLALNKVADHLQIIAKTNKVLRPPSGDELGGFTDAVARLCRVMAEACELRDQRIKLFLTFDRPIVLGSWRSWQANLIIAELINNACRHAFGSRSGRIAVRISESHGRVVCDVGDDGCGPKAPSVGLGDLADRRAGR